VGKKIVNDIFEFARGKAQSIIFIDEIEAFFGVDMTPEKQMFKLVKDEFIKQMMENKNNKNLLVFECQKRTSKKRTKTRVFYLSNITEHIMIFFSK
jgi:SpoVK/Ycf46/Vps4 family AAA+-type ATPase